MGKRKKRRPSTPLAWMAAKGFFRLLFQGILKAGPLVIFLAVGIGIFWGIRENLYADPGFLIQSVEIIPERLLTPEKVQELRSLYLNRNLFKVSPRDVAQEVEKDPQIQHAQVSRFFPRTLRIEVLDRSVFGQVQLPPQNTYYSVGEDGVVTGIDSSPSKHLLLIEILDESELGLEKGRKVPLPAFKEAVALTKAFKAHPLGYSETIERIRLDRLGNVALVLAKGPELRFGMHPMKKFRNVDSLTPLLKDPERSQIIYIELQYQDLIVRKR